MALGKIKADTLEHSTAGSVDTKFVVEGSAKAWMKFNASSGTPLINDSLNFSSFTDEATGNHTISFSSSLSLIHI